MYAFYLFLLAFAISVFSMYLDKQYARKGDSRVSEMKLVLLSVPSAGLGAWTGMYLFRHKTVKRSFQLKLAAATFLSLIAWGFYIKWRMSAA